ncbi:hypothetical protein DdX_16635 [Ditylenchus destructor]|uniref:Uncharacterized protein n=1 Tax=Ditylenchus destructor TaxID=166010 RepID=A0AAD4MQI6_9BILA|nr:hypothetical protein DdX_16635 [Ditylenchus destructor]
MTSSTRAFIIFAMFALVYGVIAKDCVVREIGEIKDKNKLENTYSEFLTLKHERLNRMHCQQQSMLNKLTSTLVGTSALLMKAGIEKMKNQGINSCHVWVADRDEEFKVLLRNFGFEICSDSLVNLEGQYKWIKMLKKDNSGAGTSGH